jgi:hypothetical protein
MKYLKLALFAVIALALSACAGLSTSTPLGAFVKADADSALALAKSANDVAAATCYQYISDSISTDRPAGFGLLYLNQIKRGSQTNLQGMLGACNGVIPLKAVPVIF